MTNIISPIIVGVIVAAFGFLTSTFFVNIGREVKLVKEQAAKALAGHIDSCLLRYKGLEDGQQRIEALIRERDQATRYRDDDFKRIIEHVEQRMNQRMAGLESKLEAAVAELLRGGRYERKL